ncbi:MarR family transcriptional regulator [uncultured Algimonas sp.]|uniref:MarR family winged helix-turn-helix transcriptional regulator n=1 Tax=uncultured Algimonas sp. TaxID=1547920 RepID=UPI002610D4EB|nr:MarR family transcriptional regulator [uncultured Algimonas sp.]
MFLLKVLPARHMVERYVDELGVNGSGAGDPDMILSALDMMRSASLLIRKVERHFSMHGLSQLKFVILVVIDRERHEAGLRHADVAARIDVSQPVLSRTIRALVEGGLVAQTPDPSDARVQRLRLTAAGRDRLHAALPDYFDIIGTHMRGVAEEGSVTWPRILAGRLV